MVINAILAYKQFTMEGGKNLDKTHNIQVQSDQKHIV